MKYEEPRYAALVMRIAQISLINGARNDGTSMRVTGLSRSLHDLGQSVITVCPSNSRSLVGDFMKADAPLMRHLAWLCSPDSPFDVLAEGYPRIRMPAYHLLHPLAKFGLRSVRSCSILHCHLHRATSLMEGVRTSGQKVLFDFHGMYMLTDTQGTTAEAIDPATSTRIIKWQKRTFEDADGISFVTPLLRERIVDLYDIDADKTHVIPDGVDFNHISRSWDEDAAMALRQSWGGLTRIVVMYVGFLDSLHGGEYLNNVAQELLRDSDGSQDVRIVVVGRGHLANEFVDLERCFRGRFTFLSGVSYEMLPTYLAAADILVVPHPRNMLMDSIEPGKLLNYLASGKPTVVTSLTSTRRFLRDGVTSILCNPDSPSTMVSGIRRLADSPELRNRIGANGAALVRDARDWSCVARTALDVYGKL